MILMICKFGELLTFTGKRKEEISPGTLITRSIQMRGSTSREIRCRLSRVLTRTDESSLRSFCFQLDQAVFSASYDANEKYDAYQRDIALVTFYFETNTVFEFSRKVIKSEPIKSN